MYRRAMGPTNATHGHLLRDALSSRLHRTLFLHDHSIHARLQLLQTMSWKKPMRL